MRADRLVAILLMLQRRGRVTATEVADELEISERTARRDLEALGMAGLPVYSLRGRNGGWALAGGGRTDLSGLNEAEVRTLFLLAGPASQATPEVRAALRKLVRALPESFRSQAEAAARAVVVDPSGWGSTGWARRDPPLLEAVQRAVVAGRQARLQYVSRDGQSTERSVHPLGMAKKGSTWYLVAETDAGRRTFRVDRMVSLELTADPVVRPDDFDLAETWRSVIEEVEERRSPLRAKALAHPDILGVLRWVLGPRVRVGSVSPDGRVEIELRSTSERSLAGEIAGFGAALEILEPPEVRELLAEIGRQLGQCYASAASGRD